MTYIHYAKCIVQRHLVCTIRSETVNIVNYIFKRIIISSSFRGMNLWTWCSPMPVNKMYVSHANKNHAFHLDLISHMWKVFFTSIIFLEPLFIPIKDLQKVFIGDSGKMCHFIPPFLTPIYCAVFFLSLKWLFSQRVRITRSFGITRKPESLEASESPAAKKR